MSATLKRYAVEDLSVGMFVTALDCPASSTPFPLQGFYIRKKEELQELAIYCNYVVVNISKSQAVQSLSSALQLEVSDIPRALTDPIGFKAVQRARPKRQVKPRQKGRVKRLVLLLMASYGVWRYHESLIAFLNGLA